MSGTTTAAAASTATSTSAAAATSSLSPLAQIGRDLESPTFIIPMVLMLVIFIGVAVWACVYNCTNKAAYRRTFVEYNAPSSKAWIPEIHVPEKLRAARAQEATVYRFS